MIIEVVRMVVDALESEDYGVNYQLNRLPYDENDDEPPAIVKILDETRDIEAAEGTGSGDFPVLVVGMDNAIRGVGDLRPHGELRDIFVPVAIRYVTAKSQEWKADWYYTERAIRRVLDHLLLTAAEADRLRNGVALNQKAEYSAGDLGLRNTQTSMMLAGASVIRLQARDSDTSAT